MTTPASETRKAPTHTTVRGAKLAASAADANAAAATPRYPADSLSPSARPRRAGPTRSIFISTVIDQASPWFTPRKTFATTISHQLGATAISGATGSANNQPMTRSRLRPTRSASAPAPKLANAFAAPNATTKARIATFEVRPKSCSPTRGRTLRSRPTIAPTSAFRPTRRLNCAAFARSPSRIWLTSWLE